MSSWAEIAAQTIERVSLTIPEGATFAERKRAIDQAYPFGERAHWPYKAWLKARKRYLQPFDPMTPAPLFPDWPRDPVTGRPVIR